MNKPVTNIANGSHRVRTPGMLPHDREQALIRAWQARGDRAARDHLLAAFGPLAASIAKRYRRDTGEVDPDLLQQANIGLMKAADRFDTDRGLRFSTYAAWWVRDEVQNYARSNMSIVRRPNSHQTRAAVARLASLDAQTPADRGADSAEQDKQLAASLGVGEKRAAELRALVTGRDQSLNAPAQDEDGTERIALLVDPASLDAPLPLQRLETADLRAVLAETLATLPRREREIIVATQVSDPPATLEGLGDHYGVSKERVRQLRERAFARLREALADRGVGPDHLA
ncbi:MAG: sigma-70 family RNA polymerase sigma factor [Salibaculum sp.]|uniref:sigma-70 family RNA polymerase sigma factor n=1 Tax=Salibaculum sp. TaxID=2855480 RepID=UPI0028707A1D|nr:sigma-70 family RNA polymerase sigma factor [Salibaculum sp.]MDR9482581.1 sigma-70 family RNA polymerase sigma factor [Salibaculum sp.]